MGVEAIDVDQDPKDCLNGADHQYREISAISPEESSEQREDGPSDKEDEKESEDVVAIGDVVATDCSRGEEVSKEADDR